MRAILAALLVAFCFSGCLSKTKEVKEEWVQLFNGNDLEGWTVKIRNYPVGENFGNTFRVEDGLLKVRYDAYDEFNERFGHLYTNKDYSHYRLRMEYRFVGDQVKGGPGWAYRNSGAMLHCPPPETMHIDQDFPVSIEAQILGGDGTGERTTANVCTPGTELFIDGKHYTGHCYNSKSKTYDGDQWVTLEIEVRGDSIVNHIMEGETVLSYTRLTVGGGNVSPRPNIAPGPLKSGRISLQSESHPIDYRKVEIMELKENN